MCIMKLKLVTAKSNQFQHNVSMTQSVSSNSNRLTNEEILTSQTLLFSIISYCLDSLMNFTLNFADSNYISKLDEYKLILAFQLTPPSTFDVQSQLSFGGILWLIDYILKIVYRVNCANFKYINFILQSI